MACAISWAGRLGGRPRALVTALGLTTLCAIQGLAATQAAALPQVAFRASGDAAGLLYPGGPAQGIPLTLENPTSKAVYVTQVSARLRDTGAIGCDPAWFQTTALELPRGGIQILPKGAVKLASAGMGEPTIQMRESGTDQSACRNTTLTLTYSEKTHPATADQASSPSNPGGGGGGALPFTGLLLAQLAAVGALIVLGGLVLRSPSWRRRGHGAALRERR